MLCVGYTGARCEVNPDDCVGVVCVHGQCVDGADNFSCECDPGYQGRLCEREIDECRTHPCKNGGTCIDRLNQFVCVCPSGTTGLFQINFFCSSYTNRKPIYTVSQ